MSKRVLPLFSFRIFMVSCFTFSSLIKLQLIFVYGRKDCSNLILLNVAIQFFPAPFIEEIAFSPLYTLASHVID